jgi:ADP-heptose:LPS heptosyltransferase
LRIKFAGVGYQHILVIRLSSIGDIVGFRCRHSVPEKNIPDAVIDVLPKQRFHDVLAKNPYINRVLAYEEISATAQKSERYDLLVDFQANLRSRLLCRKFGKTELSG